VRVKNMPLHPMSKDMRWSTHVTGESQKDSIFHMYFVFFLLSIS